MWDRAPFAHTAPCAISPDSSTMRRRSVARTIGGSPPTWGASAATSPTNFRMSSRGWPAWSPSRSWIGPWLTPIPNLNRPPDSSWITAAVWA